MRAIGPHSPFQDIRSASQTASSPGGPDVSGSRSARDGESDASTPAGSPSNELAGLLPRNRGAVRASANDRAQSLPTSSLGLSPAELHRAQTNLAAQFEASVQSIPQSLEIDLSGHGEPFSNINNVTQIRNNPALRTTRDCLEFVFSCIRNESNADEIDKLIHQQNQTLLDKGIDTKDKLCDIFNAARRRDLATGAANGMVSGFAFNLSSLAINEQGAGMLVSSVGGTTPAHMAAVGAGAGFGLSVADVASGPAAKKTFLRAYFTRPEDDLLPPSLLEAREKSQHTMNSLGRDLALGFMGTYGGRNVGRYLIEAGIVAGKGDRALAATVDNALDVGGGMVASMAFKVYMQARDQTAGRAGLHHFCGRKDLAECIDALQAPLATQALNVGKRCVSHLVNAVTQLPGGIRDALTTADGWTSHLVLTAGFSAVLAAQAAIKSAISPAKEAAAALTTPSGLELTSAALQEVRSGLTTDQMAMLAADGVTKLATLPALYAAYGQAMAFVAFDGPNTTNWPYPYTPKQLADAAGVEIERRRGTPVVIEMPPDILDEVGIEMSDLAPAFDASPRMRSTTM